MANPPRICVVGSSNMDLTFRTPQLPRPGATLAGTAFQTDFGGKGANQAVMAARFGARVHLVGRVGRDVFGQQILQHYQAEGINIRHVRTDPNAPTGVAAIFVDEQAQNCILVVAGANFCLTPADVQEAGDVIHAADAVVCQLEVPVETTLEALRLAHSAGVRTILNPAPAGLLPDEVLQLTDVCIPNETELELLTGLQTATLEQIEHAARALRKRGPAIVIVTLGQRGALVLEGEKSESVAAFPVKAVDPTGAGDAFIGSLAVFLSGGTSLRSAVERANRVAACSVTRAGAQASFPTQAEVESLRNELAQGPHAW